jgi:hypothetical protein
LGKGIFMFVRQPAARWVIGALGLLAVVMGAFGVIDPDGQAHMMGLSLIRGRPLGDHTEEMLMITSLAAINTGSLYLAGAMKQWSGFVVWAIKARFVMGSGLRACPV